MRFAAIILEVGNAPAEKTQGMLFSLRPMRFFDTNEFMSLGSKKYGNDQFGGIIVNCDQVSSEKW
jgi:hypothetical protein